MPQNSSSDRITLFRDRIARSKSMRDTLMGEWDTNVQYRRGKSFSSDSNVNRLPIPVDWAMTKRKVAQLYSQTPQAILTPKQDQFQQAVPVFAALLNDTLRKEGVGTAIEECLPDAINAAGVGAVMVSYEARTETVQAPTMNPATLSPEQKLAMQLGTWSIPTMPVERIVDRRFPITRISPWDLLWPDDYINSDFDKGPWLGRTGRMTKAEAKHELRLSDEQIELAAGAARNNRSTSSSQSAQQQAVDSDLISYDEIYYWRHLYHPEEKYFHAIQRVVFVEGIDEPVIDEPWKGQQFLEGRGYVGACRLPIRVLTLNYLTDDPIPPSDSEIGRPQVDELNRSHQQILLQRERSLPWRWFDATRVDPTMLDQLMSGTWQGAVPTQGDGSRVIGEVARANYPREDFEFDRIARQYLQESWGIGPNQMGTLASGERSASEARITQANFSTQIGQERAKVAAFFVGIAEVLAGLLALYGDFELPAVSEEQAQRLQGWDRRAISGEFVYSVYADSTLRLDATDRIERITHFLNYGAKSGVVNVPYIIGELAMLTGLDPARALMQPQPSKPEPLNISIRNAEDLRDPLMLALLLATGQAPSPEHLQGAKNMLQAALAPMSIAPAAPQPAAPMPMNTPMPTPSPEGWGLADRLDRRRSEE